MHGVDDVPLQHLGNQEVGGKQQRQQTGLGSSVLGDLMGWEVKMQDVVAKPNQRPQSGRDDVQAAALHLPEELGKILVFVVPPGDG